MKLSSILTRTLLAGAMLTLATTASQAAIIPLTGGDAGEGYAPLSTVFAAVDFGGAGGQTVQGVLFTGSNANIALSTVTTQTVALGAPPFALTTANDNALFSIGDSSVFNNPGPITLTISGLTVGQAYQVDSFIGLSAGFTDRTVQATATGAIVLAEGSEIADGLLRNFSQTLQPDALGKIVVSYAVTAGFSAPNINGISVTSAPVPEPGTALFGLALLGATGLSRRRRTQA